MANQDNKCSDLIISKIEFNQWDQIFEMQKSLQEFLGYDFKNMSLKEISEFFLFNKHALEDEMGEMMDALGGVNDGIGSAVWKKWKKDNLETHLLSINSLSKRDRKELLMEIVDIFHFVINFPIACGFTGSEIANAYIAKNKENVERQKRGY